MAGLSRETLQGIAREVFGMELTTADVEEVLALLGVWQERLARLCELDVDGIDPAFLVNPESE